MISQMLLKKVFTIGAMILAPALSFAAGFEMHNTTEKITGTFASGNSNFLIGPNASITVDGDWYITASSLYIHPSAAISGTGTIHLMSPNTYGQGVAATQFDPGGITIGCKLSLENTATVVLASINPAASPFTGSGITDPGTAGSNNLVMSNNVNFNNVGAHLLLGASDIIFNSGTPTITYSDLNTAGFTSDPTPGAPDQAYIVTNAAGVVTKRQLANASNFNFPVGQSTTTDYTPVSVNYTAGSTRDVSAQVKNYSTSTAVEGNVAFGVDRSWRITGAGTATLALTNNASSEGGSYSRNRAFVSQQIANGVWDTTARTAPTTPNYTHSRSSLIIPASVATTSFFTKSNDSVRSTSLNTRLDLTAGLQGAMQAGGMKNELQIYTANNDGLLPTTDPYGLGASYASINDTTGVAGKIADWIRVETRDATNPSSANTFQSRALLLKTNGSIVDVDGTIPVFTGQSVPVKVVVRHRSHLAVMANSINNFKGMMTYNFTTSLSQAAVDPGDPAQMVLSNSKWCLRVGDFSVNQDLSIDNQDFGALRVVFVQGPFDVYNIHDINMDGSVDNTDFAFLRPIYNLGFYSSLLNY